MIYLDYNASTPVDPAVRDAMLPFLGQVHGNPSSRHAAGKPIRDAVENARRQVADLIDADPAEIIFTSSGTESNNHVIKGVADTRRDQGRHIIISAVEHPAVSAPAQYLAGRGYEVTVAPVDECGMVDPAFVEDHMRDDTILVSVMHANNEVGTLQPVRQIAAAARRRNICMHTDAAQSCGKVPVSVRELEVDVLSIAGHKFYAPLGIGALFIREGCILEPLLHGAGHEQGRRSGTEAVPAVVGLGAAAELARADAADQSGTRALRDRLEKALVRELRSTAQVLGHPEHRLPNTLAIGFRNCIGADVLARCPQICASTGSACHGTLKKRSATLEAMDVPEEVAFGAVRLTVGRYTTGDEVDRAGTQLVEAVRELTRSTR